MLKDCLDVFEKQYREKGESLITDNYVLADGTYILVDSHGQIEEIIEVSKKTFDRSQCKNFIIIDYLSKLIDMNKPIDGKKIIHSNNYLSFWVKKPSLNKDEKGIIKVCEEIIDNYYKILSYPREKYKDKNKSLKLYEDLENHISVPDIAMIEKIKLWIKDNIFLILDNPKVKNDKNYLKIFFKSDISNYERENKRYIVPNIYNSTEYNVVIDECIYGLPNDNMGLNAKKPYLENKTRKCIPPYLISVEEVNIQRKFMDYLYNEACNGKSNIYITEDSIKSYKSDETPKEELNGYFLRIKKGKEVEIHDFDIITGYRPKIKEVKLEQVIPVESFIKNNNKTNLDYSEITELSELNNLVNIVFFNKFLVNNYFSEAKDIKLNDSTMKEELIRSRNAFFTWFYKGNSISIKSIFAKSSLNLVKNSICNDSRLKAIEQFNLRSAILSCLKGEEDMGDKLKVIQDLLRVKINNSDTSSIESDEEYYFAAGQLVSYLLSLNKGSKKMHSMINPILNCTTDVKLKGEIGKLFKKYNYTISQNNKRFNNLHSMILGYEVEEGKVKEELLISGYLYSSLIYEKSDKKEEK